MSLSFFANSIDDQSNTNRMITEKLHPVKTELKAAAVFPQTVSVALERLKERLQRTYERVYPDLREIIHLVLDEEEAEARELSSFPHLLLPDLVETHLARLNLQPVISARDAAVMPQLFAPVPQLAFA